MTRKSSKMLDEESEYVRKMKRLLKRKGKRRNLISVTAFVIVLAVIIIAGIIGRMETHYRKTGFITSNECGIVTIEDFDGNMWEIESDTLCVGDVVEMTLFDVGTADVEDDIVQEIKVMTGK